MADPDRKPVQSSPAQAPAPEPSVQVYEAPAKPKAKPVAKTTPKPTPVKTAVPAKKAVKKTKPKAKPVAHEPQIKSAKQTRESSSPVAWIVGAVVVIALLVFIIVAANHWSTNNAVDENVVVRVNGIPVTEQDIYEVGLSARQYGADIPREVIINQSILIALLRDTAAKQGIVADQQEVDETFAQREQFIKSQVSEEQYAQLLASINMTEEQFKAAEKKAIRDDLVISELLRRNVYSTIPNVTESEAVAFYRANESLFYMPEERKARHILICYNGALNCNKDTLKEDALDQITDLRDRLVDEPESFGALAAQYSTDPGAPQNGGDLGYFTKGQLVPEFEQVAFNMSVGQISPVVETMFGYHLIVVDDIKQPRISPYDEVADAIKQEIYAQKALAAERAYYQGLLLQATVEYN